MPSVPIVREAAEPDLPRLLELLAQLSLDAPRESQDEASAAGYVEAFHAVKSDPRQTVLVAQIDGRVVGTLTLIIVPNLSYRGQPYAVLENIVVDEKERRAGHGARLIGAAVERARAAGCYKVSLTSDHRRTGAHSFYERLGFQHRQRGYRLGL